MAAINAVTDLTREGDIALVTINSPPVNALSADVRNGLRDGVTQAAADPAVKAIVVICAGRTFIAGADISEFGKPSKGATLPELQSALEGGPKPIIAAIHGTALGGGFEMTLMCHYRVAVPSAKFGLPEIKLGLIPGAGGTQRLPRLIGSSRAKEMIFTGRQVRAEEALSIGLVNRVVAADDVLETALHWAAELAAGAVVAQGLAKSVVDAGLETTLAEGLTLEHDAFVAAAGTEDAARGLASFRENGPRKATFVGR